MTNTRLFKFSHRQPRRNLPAAVARKRGEANFVAAFSRAYIESIASSGFGGKEFELTGFGIADFVWMAWRDPTIRQYFNAASIHERKSLLHQNKLTAFEMKLADWRKGLAQAYRYSYFADLAVVVLPPEPAVAAKLELNVFRKSRVGLWSFDPATGVIRSVFSPRQSHARSSCAKGRAMDLLAQSLELSQFRKQL